MKKIGIALLAVLLGGLCLYGFWTFYQQANSVAVVFANAQGIKPGTPVAMAGLEIGRVRKIELAGDGVEVTLFLEQEARKQLTETALFVIDPGLETGGVPVIRVKAGTGGTSPLPANTRLRGVNSLALWKLNDYSQKFLEFINEPQLQEGLKKLDQLGNELQRK